MSSLLRAVLGVGIVLALLAAILFWRPPWLIDLGLDPGNPLEDTEALSRANQRAEALESRLELLQSRVEKKAAVVRGVIDGRLTLLEGGAQVKALVDAADLRYQRTFWLSHRGGSLEERSCRHLIGCVRETLKLRDPKIAEREAARLEEELQELLRRSPLLFPPVGASEGTEG